MSPLSGAGVVVLAIFLAGVDASAQTALATAGAINGRASDATELFCPTSASRSPAMP